VGSEKVLENFLWGLGKSVKEWEPCLIVICTVFQELVETNDATSSDAVVCMEETVESSEIPVGLSEDASVDAAASATDEELTVKPESSLDTVLPAGKLQSANMMLFCVFCTAVLPHLVKSECDSIWQLLMNVF